MKEINISLLLNRNEVLIKSNEISSFILNKRVLITGASGSIGSELIRQLVIFNPKTIILFDRNENNQFFLEKELRENYPNIEIIPRIGSIADRNRASAIFEETKPDIIFHTAANKHVGICELNPSEAINNNILGTHIIADIAAKMKCELFVYISTDKAVRSSSCYGCTKRIAEYIVQLMSKHNTDTRFLTVRFGNVLGSSGSVVPIFKSQIDAGGPVTVTHPDMTRFFMTIPEAAKLLLQASAYGKSGEIFVLDMGDSVKIVDLAQKMIDLLSPNNKIEIKFSGIRPGEKIFEELSFDYETTEITTHDKIRNTKTICPPDDMIEKIIRLEMLPSDTSPEILRKELSILVPEATLKI